MKLQQIKEKTKEIMGKIGKKTIVATGAVLVIGVAVLLNFILQTSDASTEEGYKLSINLSDMGDVLAGQDEDLSVDVSDGSDYFAAMALSREQARDEAMEVFQSVADNADSEMTARDEALESISAIAESIEKEANIETLLRSKGFEQCLAVVNGDEASIIVASDGLMAGEIAQISEIAYEQAGVLPENLNIIERATQ
jgi:stage III sporulation protein AH